MPDRGCIWRQVMVDVTAPDYRYFHICIQNIFTLTVTLKLPVSCFVTGELASPILTNYFGGFHVWVCRYIIYASFANHFVLVQRGKI